VRPPTILSESQKVQRTQKTQKVCFVYQKV